MKSGATAEMADLIARHAPADAIVVSLQNGIGNVDALRARLGASRTIVPGMVPFNVVQTRNGGQQPRFHRATSGIILIAAGVPGLREALDVPGAAVAEHPDMTGVQWGKLILNLNNALNALAGIPLAAELADRRWRVLLAAQIGEALASAEGVRRPSCRRRGCAAARHPDHPAPARYAVPPRGAAHAGHRSAGALVHVGRLAARRTTEIDHLQGAILALAKTAGVAAPMTQRIADLIKEAEDARAGSPGLAPDQIADSIPLPPHAGGMSST